MGISAAKPAATQTPADTYRSPTEEMPPEYAQKHQRKQTIAGAVSTMGTEIGQVIICKSAGKKESCGNLLIFLVGALPVL